MSQKLTQAQLRDKEDKEAYDALFAAAYAFAEALHTLKSRGLFVTVGLVGYHGTQGIRGSCRRDFKNKSTQVGRFFIDENLSTHHE